MGSCIKVIKRTVQIKHDEQPKLEMYIMLFKYYLESKTVMRNVGEDVMYFWRSQKLGCFVSAAE